MVSLRRPLAWIAGGAALFLLLAHATLLWRAHRYYAHGREHQAAGRMLEAARQYQTAIGFYAPLNPWSRAAARALGGMVEGLRDESSPLAFELEDRLRRSLQGIRWLIHPYRNLLNGAGASPREAPRDPNPWLFFLSLAGLAAAAAAPWPRGWCLMARTLVMAGGMALWALALRFC